LSTGRTATWCETVRHPRREHPRRLARRSRRATGGEVAAVSEISGRSCAIRGCFQISSWTP